MKIKVYKKFNGKWALSRVVYSNNFEIDYRSFPNGCSINQVVVHVGDYCDYIEFSKIRRWLNTITVWEKDLRSTHAKDWEKGK